MAANHGDTYQECAGEQTDDDSSTDPHTSVLCTFGTTYRSFDYEYDEGTSSSDDEPLASLCGPVEELYYTESQSSEPESGSKENKKPVDPNSTPAVAAVPKPRARISNYFSEKARENMKKLQEVQHNSRVLSLLNPSASFMRCPQGHVSSNSYFRRQIPGTYTNCPMPNHVEGDEFYKLPLRTKPVRSFEPWKRPPEVKERKKRM